MNSYYSTQIRSIVRAKVSAALMGLGGHMITTASKELPHTLLRQEEHVGRISYLLMETELIKR